MNVEMFGVGTQSGNAVEGIVVSAQLGIWYSDGAAATPLFLTTLAKYVSIYGEGGESSYFDGPVGMLYWPFCTTPESRRERHPFYSLAGEVIMWDGRLDNRTDLTAQLRAAFHEDATDAQIFAAAFDKWDINCFAHLIGDWAVSLWNPRKQRLLLARDYIGVRQLFYYRRHNRILWSSHLDPIALCGDRFSVCRQYMAGFLLADPDTDLTPYEEIRAVPAGGVVELQRERSQTHTYWSFNTRSKTRCKTDSEYEEQYRSLLHQSVGRRLRSDSCVLAELSGGFDSSSIVCVADAALADKSSLTSGLETFSYHDSNELADDDLPYFTLVEQKRGKSGIHLDLNASGDSLRIDCAGFNVRPDFGGREELNTAMATFVRNSGYRVVLSGRGGDDVNGQTLAPQVQMAEFLSQCRFAQLASDLKAWSLLIRKRPWIQLLIQTVVQTFKAYLSTTPQRSIPATWVNPTLAHQLQLRRGRGVHVTRKWLLSPGAHDAVETLSTLSRRISSVVPAPGIEIRYPYLDRDLVEFLLTIPLAQKLRPGERRFLMRRALAEIVPTEVLQRKTKAGAARCFPLTLDRHWNELQAVFSDSLSADLGLIDRDRFLADLSALKNGRIYRNALQLLRVISLELWLNDSASRGIISIRSSIPADAAARDFEPVV